MEDIFFRFGGLFTVQLVVVSFNAFAAASFASLWSFFISCYDFKECADINKLARYENYAQRIASMPYRRRLSIKRYKGNSVTFTIEILRIYENDLTARELLEVYTGKDRAKALSRFEQLKKENNGSESVKDIAKGRWER